MALAAAAAPDATRPSGLTLKRGNGHRPRVLFAEDSDPARVVVSAMLKGMGCDVDAVMHGEEALRSASDGTFDVILLDIEMPVMDGITAARSIRRLGGSASTTPIMALSAFLADAMQSANWTETFDIALPKPANKNELHAAVKAALDWRPHNPGRPGDPPLVCATMMSELGTGLNPALLKELLTVACRDIEQCVRQLEQLQRTAIRGADQVYVQKLMALSRTFAAPRLARDAEALFRSARLAGRKEQIAGLIATAADTCAALRAL